MHINLRGDNTAFAALLLGMLMASLDTNVVVAALPAIGADLGGTTATGGVTAAYLLAVAIATPVHGSLGDRWGRRRTFAGSVLLFAGGSLACALAPGGMALVAFRAVQGLGGGGLIVAAVAGMAELFDRTELVRRQGWLTAVFAVSSIGGAPLGGVLAGTVGWRSIFLLNLPICVVALLGARAVPGVRHARGTRFDWAGASLVAVAAGGVVALGSSDALSGPVLVLVLGAAIAFVHVERRAVAPLVPPRLFADTRLARAIGVTFLSGVALFGSFTYVPAAVGGASATTGLLLLPMSAGQLVVTSAFAALARRLPNLAAWGRWGLALGVAGLLVTAAIPAVPPGPLRLLVIVAGLAASGAALGLSMQVYSLLAQSWAPAEVLGSAMATLTFARQIGGSLGIAGFGFLAGPAVFVAAAAALLVAWVFAPREARGRVAR